VADFERIESVSDLDALAHDLLGEPVLAVDTEADSFYHYFDKVCLIQIASSTLSP
jgi:ribonuclease D